jgi:hypothetical protein
MLNLMGLVSRAATHEKALLPRPAEEVAWLGRPKTPLERNLGGSESSMMWC